MADKSFGIKELNLIGTSGTPTITSPNNLNLNASNVAISTDLTVARHLDVDGHAEFDAVNVSGVSTFAGNIQSGRLLVGTTDSSGVQLLKVNGSTSGTTQGGTMSLTQGRTAPPNGSTHGIIYFGSETRPDGGAAIVSFADGAWTDGSDHNSGLYFATTANGATSVTERLRINAAGFIDAHQGAGWTYGDNAHAFRRDNASDTYIAKFIHEGTSTPKGLYIQYRNASPNTTGSQFLLCVDSNGSTFARIDSNGGLANYQSNNTNLCDEREKKNIVNLDSTWDCLKGWELKKFHYNEDADDANLRYGVIAQQIATSCPEVVTDWVKQEAAEAVLDEDGNELQPAREEIVRMGVKEQQMYWMAIKALQEAQTRIESLETANASQAATIAALDARLTALEG